MSDPTYQRKYDTQPDQELRAWLIQMLAEDKDSLTTSAETDLHTVLKDGVVLCK